MRKILKQIPHSHKFTFFRLLPQTYQSNFSKFAGGGRNVFFASAFVAHQISNPKIIFRHSYLIPMKIKDLDFRVYIPNEKINNRVEELAEQITWDFRGKSPVLVGVLNGCFMFLSDLVKEIDLDVEICFTKYSSYQSTESSGKVIELIGFDNVIKGKDVIIVEDIVDTGLTMGHLLKEIQKFSPKSVKVTALLYKPEALKHEAKIDYLGFEIKNKFVVGYGLDYDGFGRNLKDIYILNNNDNPGTTEVG